MNQTAEGMHRFLYLCKFIRSSHIPPLTLLGLFSAVSNYQSALESHYTFTYSSKLLLLLLLLMPKWECERRASLRAGYGEFSMQNAVWRMHMGMSHF